MRLFSIIQWHHFAYMIISLALLGYGASGTVLCFLRSWLHRRFSLAFAAAAALFGLTAPAGFAVAQWIPLNSLEIVWDRGQQAYLLGVTLVLAVPFFCAATAIGLALSAPRARIEVLYRSDLVGAGLGASGIVGALFVFDPATCLVLIGAMGLVAAALGAWHESVRRAVPVTLLAAALALPVVWPAAWSTPRPSPYKELSLTLTVPGARVVAERSGPPRMAERRRKPDHPLSSCPGFEPQRRRRAAASARRLYRRRRHDGHHEVRRPHRAPCLSRPPVGRAPLPLGGGPASPGAGGGRRRRRVAGAPAPGAECRRGGDQSPDGGPRRSGFRRLCRPPLRGAWGAAAHGRGAQLHRPDEGPFRPHSGGAPRFLQRRLGRAARPQRKHPLHRRGLPDLPVEAGAGRHPGDHPLAQGAAPRQPQAVRHRHRGPGPRRGGGARPPPRPDPKLEDFDAPGQERPPRARRRGGRAPLLPRAFIRHRPPARHDGRRGQPLQHTGAAVSSYWRHGASRSRAAPLPRRLHIRRRADHRRAALLLPVPQMEHPGGPACAGRWAACAWSNGDT